MTHKTRLLKLSAKLSVLRRRLHSREEYTRGTALELILELCTAMPDAAMKLLPQLIARTRDESSAVRLLAVKVLALVPAKDESVIEALRASLRDNDWDTALTSAEALASIGFVSDVLSVPIACLEDPNQNILRSSRAYHVIETLGPRASAVVPLLERHLRLDSLEVQRGAASALYAVVGEPTHLVLLNVLKEENPSVRAGAVSVMGESFLANNNVVVGLIQSLKHDSDPHVRGAAAEALSSGELNATSTRAALDVALKDKNQLVKIKAARGLVRAKGWDKTTLGILSQSLNSDEELVRREATWCLSQLASEQCESLVADLSKRLADRNSNIASYASQALTRVGRVAVPFLMAVLVGLDHYPKYWACQALMGMEYCPKEAKETLLDLLASKEKRATNVDTVSECAEGFEEDVPFMALMALSRVVDSGDTDAISVLSAALSWEHEKVRRCAAAGLGRIGNSAQSVVAVLRRALSDEDRDVRAAVRAALKAVKEKPS
jgi:HEAT repeat protein